MGEAKDRLASHHWFVVKMQCPLTGITTSAEGHDGHALIRQCEEDMEYRLDAEQLKSGVSGLHKTFHEYGD